MKKILGLGLVLALAGCAGTSGPYAFRQENDRRVEDIAALRQTYRQQQMDHSYDVIRAKLSLSESYNKRGSPCEGRIANATATPDEQAALRRWSAQRAEFLTRLEAAARPVDHMPEHLKSISENFDRMRFEEEAKITEKLDELSQGRITYCQYAEASKQINWEADKIASRFRDQMHEENSIEFYRRYGYPSVTLVYTMP